MLSSSEWYKEEKGPVTASPSPDEIIRGFGLAPHPEGGFFKETYRSPEVITQSSLPQRFGGDRCFSTAIYYLLTQGQKSKLHRIHSDEMWHFYLGDPLIVAGIDQSGQPYEIVLGQDIGAGQRVQYTVKAGHWFGARPSPRFQVQFRWMYGRTRIRFR
jgi:uncharacterized protein